MSGPRDIAGAFAHHGHPVILTHLGTDDTPAGRRLAACSGEPFSTTRDYPAVPRVLCPGCALALRTVPVAGHAPALLGEARRRLARAGRLWRRGRGFGYPRCCVARFALDALTERRGAPRGLTAARPDGERWVPCGLLHRAAGVTPPAPGTTGR